MGNLHLSGNRGNCQSENWRGSIRHRLQWQIAKVQQRKLEGQKQHKLVKQTKRQVACYLKPWMYFFADGFNITEMIISFLVKGDKIFEHFFLYFFVYKKNMIFFFTTFLKEICLWSLLSQLSLLSLLSLMSLVQPMSLLSLLSLIQLGSKVDRQVGRQVRRQVGRQVDQVTFSQCLVTKQLTYQPTDQQLDFQSCSGQLQKTKHCQTF